MKENRIIQGNLENGVKANQITMEEIMNKLDMYVRMEHIDELLER